MEGAKPNLGPNGSPNESITHAIYVSDFFFGPNTAKENTIQESWRGQFRLNGLFTAAAAKSDVRFFGDASPLRCDVPLDPLPPPPPT